MDASSETPHQISQTKVTYHTSHGNTFHTPLGSNSVPQLQAGNFQQRVYIMGWVIITTCRWEGLETTHCTIPPFHLLEVRNVTRHWSAVFNLSDVSWQLALSCRSRSMNAIYALMILKFFLDLVSANTLFDLATPHPRLSVDLLVIDCATRTLARGINTRDVT